MELTYKDDRIELMDALLNTCAISEGAMQILANLINEQVASARITDGDAWADYLTSKNIQIQSN